MTKSIAEKMGVKKDMRTIFIAAPANLGEILNFSEVKPQKRLAGAFDYIHLFVITQAEFDHKFPKAMHHLKQRGMLWVSWPKSGKEQTDLKLTTIIKMGYDYGLVESKSISLDETWSALKFTHPKKGQVYNNSYGELKL